MLNQKTRALQIILTTSLLLAACGTKSTATPTIDPNVIFTAAAQTVEAQLTQAAASNPAPTETPEAPPANSPQPSNETPAAPPADQSGGTPAIPPGATLPVLSPVTPEGTTPQPGATLPANLAVPTTGGVPAGPVVPTNTLGPTADKCEWQSNDPPDNTTVTKGEGFDEIWNIKNSGTTTWKKGKYMLRFFSGERFASGQRNDYPFRNDVKPGEIYQAIADMDPQKTGNKLYGNWVLSNESLQNFCWITITLNVTN